MTCDFLLVEFVYVFDCSWNYRPDHCMYMSVCKAAEVSGINVVHGNRRVFHNDKQPVFRAVYDSYVEVSLLALGPWLLWVFMGVSLIISVSV